MSELPQRRLNVLFLCTGNSCRSQMAEGWARRLKSDSIEPYSAGTVSHGLNPLAVKVMAEENVDISQHASKTLKDVMHIRFDYVITVCADADANCPVFPGKTVKLHRGFDDPPRLAKAVSSEAAVMAIYRRVRDEIRAFVETLPGWLMEHSPKGING